MIPPAAAVGGPRHGARGRGVVVRSALLAILLGLPAMAGTVLGEEVLLSLPRDFDVRPIGGWGQHGSGERQRIPLPDIEKSDVVFRFRGEQVTQETTTTDRHDLPDCQVHITSSQDFQATFRRGELTGRWVSRQRNYYRGCNDRDDGEYLRSRNEGTATGQANADGRLEIVVHVSEGEIVDHRMEYVGEPKKGRWHYRGWEVRDQPHQPWSFGLEFQLPVGELQSSQELSTPPPPEPPGVPPPASPGVPTREPTGVPGSTPSGGPVDAIPPGPLPRGPFDGPAVDDTPDLGPASGPREPEPASPAETAGATVGSGLLIGLGAWLLARANGTGLGDLLGGLGEWLEGQTSSDPPGEAQSTPAQPPQAPVPGPPPVDIEPNDPGPVASDVEATRPPDDLGQVAREIVAGDRRIAARAERIARLDEELNQEMEEIQQESDALGLDPQGQVLQDLFGEHQEEFARQGYRVLNPGYDMALPVRELVDAGALLSSFVRSGQAVRCEQFADLGKEALEKSLRERFGPEADGFIVDSVVIDVARGDSWSGRAEAFLDVVVPKNHVATRVVLPDGRRFVLDHWDASRGRGRRMLSEEEWFERWHRRMGEDTVFNGSGDYGQQLREERLQEAVTKTLGRGGSEEEGLARFRDDEISRIRRGAGTDAEKAAQVRKVETLVRSYERCGGLGPGTRDGA